MNLYDDLPSPCSSDTEAIDSTPLNILPVTIPEKEIVTKETAKVTEAAGPQQNLPQPDSPTENSLSPDPTPEKEFKPVVPSLQFIPPALRAKALHKSSKQNLPLKPSVISRSTVTNPHNIPNAIIDSNVISVMLDDVEDEYDPLRPNEYSTYKEILKQKRKEKKWQNKEHERMLSILHDVASGTSLDKVKESKEDFGVRIMKKFGWKDGQGLGKDSQGISVPLVARKTGDQSGFIVNTDLKFQHSLSTVVLLENMTDVLDPELESEVKEECTNFGTVIKVVGATGFDSAIRIFVEFDTHKEAKIALEKLNGRFFGGRQIAAKLYPLANYKRREYTS